MDYDTLRLFLHLSRTLHFGRTSKECHVSPSALSRAIARLEDHVGWPLLERDQRRVALTPEGVAFAAHAQETLTRWQQLQQKLARKAEVLTGELALFASVTACQTFLPPLLSSFRQTHPEVHIKLETGYAADALGMLNKGVVDATVAALPDKVPPSLEARVVVVTPLVLVVPASDCEAARQMALPVVPWEDVPFVLPAVGLARAAADRWFRKRKFSPRIYSELPGNEAILSLVAVGCGVGIVPRLVADRSPLRDEFRVIEPKPALDPFRVGVCTQKLKLKSPIVRAFWDSIDKLPGG
ncbi:MAG: HTH-type transcriptional activator IlvY [Deltaproteobacteria bacterium]|nr:HTH-type transcriptional activator IlvY [Deltaproteobacteria bacterium]